MNSLDFDTIKAIETGALSLQITLTKKQHQQLIDYLTLLLKWNDTYNLTAIRDPKKMITHHLLDALAVTPFFAGIKNVLDVGSGAGIPGIILAIIYPELGVSLVDTVHKKTAFLMQVKMNLGLNNVTIYTKHVEKLVVQEKFEIIISRAFSELRRFVLLSNELLTESGTFIAMKGRILKEEIAQLPSDWEVNKICPLKVPNLIEERHLIFIQKIKNTQDK